MAGSGAPGLEGGKGDMAFDINAIEIIHAGAPERSIRYGKAGGFDDGGANARAGAKPQHRAGILRNVGLKQGEAQSHVHLIRLRRVASTAPAVRVGGIDFHHEWR